MKALDAIYTIRIQNFSNRENSFLKKGRYFSTARLIVGMLLFLQLWKALTTVSFFWISLFLASFSLFLILVRLHAGVNKSQRYFSRLRAINEQEKAALKGDYSTLFTGDNYSDGDHSFSHDLDVFGKNSIFQLLNRTVTSVGEAFLAKSLTVAKVDRAQLLERQKAVSELTPLTDFRQRFMAIGQEIREESSEINSLMNWLQSPKSSLNRPIIRFLSFSLPAIVICLSIFAIAGIQSYVWIIVSILFNLAFVQFFISPITKTHTLVSKKHQILEKYGRLTELIDAEPFENPMLNSLRENSKKASKSIQRLSVTISFFDQRLNDLAAVLLNGFFLSDFHCIIALDAWKHRYKEHMAGWLDAVSKIDELNSIANFAFNHPDYTYPVFDPSVFINAENLGHPLIKRDQCVRNDFKCSKGEKVIILTGANMAGKSTFLRSLGVNLVLAGSGAPVFATTFHCNFVPIYSSMRIADSLTEDTSYFYQELKRLTAVMDILRKGKSMVILLDEMLKGTNSEDKLSGSIGLIEEFLQHNCLCIIATHDLALGKLEEKYPESIKNYCFESRLKDDHLHFDYTIRRGIAKNKNATFLMQKRGLIK